MKKYKKNTRLEVFFRDIVSDPKWYDDDQMKKEPDDLCIALGYYYKHTKTHLYLSPMISSKERDKTTIPIGAIVKWQVVTPTDAPAEPKVG